MAKKILIVTMITIILCSTIFLQQVSSETINQPARLNISITPPSIPSDNRTYNCIFIQLQDLEGKPARATRDTIISLSSSLIEIGTVDPTITIRNGETYASATFSTTFTPGVTVITAATTGYEAVQATVTTVGPKPYTIAVYGFPSTLPADGRTYEAIMVQLQDSSGSPAKAPNGGTKVTLSCSDTDVGDVTSNVTILEGQTYALANFTTTLNNGEAVITPIASDYTSKATKITTASITVSQQLKISTGPTSVLADNIAYRQIAVQIIDNNGNLGLAPSDILVTIASSDQSIGTTESQIIIPQSRNYALATLTTTYKAGTTTITAAATNFEAASQGITTTGYTASKLVVYCIPSPLPADNGAYQAIQLQLQDLQGRPAKSPADLTVNLFSSQPAVAAVSSTLKISMGDTSTTGALTVTKTSGQTTITAQASSYTTGQATVETSKIDLSPLSVTVTSNPQNIVSGNTTEITAYLSSEGHPVIEANVQFASNNYGELSNVRETGAGYYKATLTSPASSLVSTITVNVTASKIGFLNAVGAIQITVDSSPTANSTSGSPGASVATRSLVMRVVDSNGNSISNVQVSSTSQPAGTTAISGTTNATGYVAFRNATSGSYTFELSKTGYEALSQTVSYNGNLVVFMLSQAQNDNTLLIIGVVIAIIVGVVVAICVVKRRKATKTVQPLNWPMHH